MHKLTAAEARKLADRTKRLEFSSSEKILLDILASAKIGKYKISGFCNEDEKIPYDLLDELKLMGYGVYIDEDNKSYHISWDRRTEAGEAHLNHAFMMKYLTDSMVMNGCHSDFLSLMLSRIEYAAAAGYSARIQGKPSGRYAQSEEGATVPTEEEWDDVVAALHRLGYGIDTDDGKTFCISW